jgi:Yip1-like protein
LGIQAKWTKNFSYGYAAVILIWNALIAAVLFATFKFGAGADTKFKTAYAIVTYASLPFLLKSILSAVSVAAGAAADSFTFQNPLASNPGYFLDPANGHFLYSVMSAVDIFMIWTLILTAIGFSVAGNVKRSTAMLIVFGWYVVFTLAGSGLSAAFS